MLPVAGLTDQATDVPETRFTTENCAVPAGATVAVVGLRLVGGGEVSEDLARLIVDVEILVESATLVAEILTAVAAGISAGAVYKPLTIVPTLGLSDQVTAVLEDPLTVAVNFIAWPALNAGPLGFSEMLTAVGCGVVGAGVVAGPSTIVAVAVLVGSAKLVAEIVTKESELTVLGAV